MNIPNILTILRFLLIPVFIYVFYSGAANSIVLAFYVFLLAGITDILDGYIARKYNRITKWGQAMDPLADKLMQMTVLACLTHRQYIPLWVILIIGAKETLLILGSLVLYHYGNKLVIPSNNFGKMATVLFYGAIFAVVFQMPYHIIWVIAAVVVTLMALVKYIIGFKKLQNKNFVG
ncbi:CDP-diacylglycerol--glycerol-3-phosphate 3-phosphatidyltransferase [Geosporobacter ferrireducens]|uniref:CDP-diacylglycerol--glycerol-3-phosphate 3-phosphatidyltransferase n=1 Tax=Geosporobacter ferrireducens TaxID=1424294 RepID=A0A1D8GD71_9FIRM|nr:CDP-diacylglycerol--glycerol-3-phosphate 3-phosphatidyltransferase [Geosporobacter ferrireducens]AOT68851.1 CDP-diacylglycerol--glycerol-3-phosphate 3-phosphatidyltransferase [Geosporobacter ferrireducens]MTI54916.1 CDP-diacylglycerol--glycerol-3-phosphate 3-phosphatidyltransferase [Geosporobacter ferrireducens]